MSEQRLTSDLSICLPLSLPVSHIRISTPQICKQITTVLPSPLLVLVIQSERHIYCWIYFNLKSVCN